MTEQVSQVPRIDQANGRLAITILLMLLLAASSTNDQFDDPRLGRT